MPPQQLPRSVLITQSLLLLQLLSMRYRPAAMPISQASPKMESQSFGNSWMPEWQFCEGQRTVGWIYCSEPPCATAGEERKRQREGKGRQMIFFPKNSSSWPPLSPDGLDEWTLSHISGDCLLTNDFVVGRALIKLIHKMDFPIMAFYGADAHAPQ